MVDLPESVQPALRRLARRLAVGLFLDVWPTWAAASVLLAGSVALVCRLFFPAASSALPWLWLAPVLAAIPVFVLCTMRAYRPHEVVAVADWLGGGQGTLLTLLETGDSAWTASPAVHFPLPRLRPWRRLASLAPALVFFVIALFLPQRVPAQAADAALAEDIAKTLKATVAELKQEALITPEEEQRLEEEIERIRQGAKERVDASSWEAADALREKVAADLSAKQDAVKWAEESLGRYAAAQAAASADPNTRAGADSNATAEAEAAELTKALENLAKSGLLANAPPELKSLLANGQLPGDAAALRALAAALAKQLAEAKGRLGGPGPGRGTGVGRFDPSEFPLEADQTSAEARPPGRGGVDRGRADAPLTWGKETSPYDKFKAEPLPPGAARSPDDWAPVVVLPGAPQESPAGSVRTTAREYEATAGQAAWRRSLKPRHQSAVKKYFQR